jgi:hypothetical protein
MKEWILELLEEIPEEFTVTENGDYIQRKDVTEVEYHSLDGYQSFHGYECLRRNLTESEYYQLTSQ